MKKNCFKKVQKCLKENVHFMTCYETKKTAMFRSASDNIPIHQKATGIYTVTCPDCNKDYAGKTDRNLVTRLNQHGSLKNQPTYQCLSKCEHFSHITDFIALPEINNKQHH